MGLVVIIGASSGIFWLLVRRWTTQRHWVAMSDWADENRFTLRGEERAVGPEILKQLTQPAPKILVSVNDVDTGIVQIEASRRRGRDADRAVEFAGEKIGAGVVDDGVSAGDQCAEHPGLFSAGGDEGDGADGAVCAVWGRGAGGTALGKSSVAAPLPPDVGLLLVGENLVLDFSVRPFDPLELQRIDALAEQIVLHLP